MARFIPEASLFAGAFVAALVAFVLIKWQAAFGGMWRDIPGRGPQKFHANPTPRVGGVPVFLGVLVCALVLTVFSPSIARVTLLGLACGLFAFAGGLAEDVTKRVGVRMRLLLTFASAALGFVFLDARITELDLPGLDAALQLTAVSFMFTLFAIGGFANAMNIVDGFNGLAGVVSLIFIAAIASVAVLVGDDFILWPALAVGAALVGFLFLNFPNGKIFLGDGGAYLVGFLIAELVVMLVHRNSEVSPWLALTMLSYPIVETFFSIYRKKLLRQQSPGEPDGLHFHMLVHKRLVRRYPGNGWSNAGTSPYLWVLALLGAAPAVVFWNDTTALEIIMAGFVLFYVWLYWRIVHFKTPRLLLARRWRAGSRGADPDSTVANVSAK